MSLLKEKSREQMDGHLLMMILGMFFFKYCYAPNGIQRNEELNLHLMGKKLECYKALLYSPRHNITI